MLVPRLVQAEANCNIATILWVRTEMLVYCNYNLILRRLSLGFEKERMNYSLLSTFLNDFSICVIFFMSDHNSH